tara:strand:+ start:654 stop:929 length:276 start_codon:yes stop_codon:yes gene_type:complete
MPVVNGKKYPYTKKGKAAASKARKGKFFGGGIETTDAFQLPGRVMGTAPKRSSKPRGISGATKYTQPPTSLPKNLGMRDRFNSGGGVAKPN